MTEREGFGSIEHVGFGGRLGAWFIDMAFWTLLAIIFLAFGGIDWLGTLLGLEPGANGYDFFVDVMLFVLSMGTLLFLYNFIFEAIRGQTLAKIMLDIITVQKGGIKISVLWAFVRSIWKTLYIFFGILLLMEGIIIYFEDRSLGDIICGTTVATGHSYRLNRDQRKPIVETKPEYVKTVRCRLCGGEVPLYEDGSGLCRGCKRPYLDIK